MFCYRCRKRMQGRSQPNQQQLQATKSPNRSATSPWTVVPRAQELTCSCSLVLPGIGSKASLLLPDEEGLLASKMEGGPAQCACRGVSQRLRQHEVHAALLRRCTGSCVKISQKDDPNPVPELSNECEAGPCMATWQGSQVALGVPQPTHYQQVSVVSV